MTDPAPASPDPAAAGPLLYLQGTAGGRMQLSALTVRPAGAPSPVVETAEGRHPGRVVLDGDGRQAIRHAFDLPRSRDAWYRVDGTTYPVDTAVEGDLRLAYVSCNGQEDNDDKRSLDERNALWRRLGEEHAARPFHLLLHGGDQLYADELREAHPLVWRWAKGKASAADSLAPETETEIRAALRRAFFRRYVEVFSQPAIAWLMARVPSLAMWDDHDICDGWGSLPADRLDVPAGRILFAVAREHFLVFQQGAAPDTPPALCLDPSGTSLSWHAALPGLDLIAPDLRSERRPDRVMGDCGWRALDAALERVADGRVLLMSSVPALGPRLSWVEAVMHLTPHAEKYEDDLRDQWQSRAHRREWREFLSRLVGLQQSGRADVTVLSGEIHLATRGTLDTSGRPIHQLVASGIAHPPPPRAYAWLLGQLARLGESPMPRHPIRLRPLPGRTGIYTAERNYLILERHGRQWSARWHLEHSGTTPSLAL